MAGLDLTGIGTTKATGAAITTLDDNPDQELDVLQTARANNVPPQVAELDLDGIKRRKKQQDAVDAVESSPAIAQTLTENPRAGKVINDDYPNLARITKGVKELFGGLGPEKMPTWADFTADAKTEDERKQSYAQRKAEADARGERFKQEHPELEGNWTVDSLGQSVIGGYGKAIANYERGKIGSRADAFGKQSIDWDRVSELDKQLNAKTEPNDFGRWMGQNLGALFTGGWETLGSGAVGAGVGAAGGAVVGPVGAGAGAVAGFTSGLARGYFVQQATNAAGNAYLNMLQTGVDDTAARVSSLGVGAINYGLNFLTMAPAAKSFVSSLTTDAIVRAMADKTTTTIVKEGIATLTKAGVTGAALGLIAEAGNSLLEQAAQHVSNLPTILNDDAQRHYVLERLSEGWKNMAAMNMLLHVPGAGHNMIADRLAAKQAQMHVEQLNTAMAQTLENKTRERSPELFEQIIRKADDKDISIPGEVIEQMGLEHFPFIKDLDQQLDHARVTGGDVTVPLGTYLTYGHDVHESIKDHVRINDALTNAEGQALGKEKLDYESPLDAPKDYRKLDDNELAGLKDTHDKIDTEFGDGTTFIEGKQAEAMIAEGILPQDAADATSGHFHRDDINEFIKREEARQPAPEEAPKGREIVPTGDPVIDHAQETRQKAEEGAAAAAGAERRTNYLSDLFKDAKAVGMSTGEFLRYAKKLEQRNNDVIAKIQRMAEAEEKRRLTPEWKENFERTRKETEEEFRNQPRYLADQVLRTGEINGVKQEDPIKLDRKEVDRLFTHWTDGSAIVDYTGLDIGDMKPPRSKDLPDTYFGKKNATPLERVATILGHDSGREMILDLVRLNKERQGMTPEQHFKDVVNKEATRRMEEQYGNLQDRIAEAGKEAAMSAKQLEVLSQEMRILIEKVPGGEAPVTLDGLRTQLQQVIDNTSMDKVRNLRGWERLTGVWGRKAELELTKGNFQSAFLAKQKQIINFLGQKYALELNRQAQKLDNTFERISRDGGWKGYDQSYIDQLQTMMVRDLGMTLKRDHDELARGMEGKPSIQDFVADREAEGKQIDIPDFLVDAQKRLNNNNGKVGIDIRKDISAEQFLILKDFVDQMMFQAKREGKIQAADKAVELSWAVAESVTSMSKLIQAGDLTNVPGAKQVVKIGRLWDAANLRMERVMQWMDGRDPNGVMNRVVFRPLSDASNYALDLRKEVAQILKKVRIENENEPIPNKYGLNDDFGKRMEFTKKDIIGMALNMGSESNLAVLSAGYKWHAPTVEQFVRENMTKSDWQTVQQIWKVFDRLWPESDRVSRDTTGVGLKKIEGREILTKDGERIQGGYYPLINKESWSYDGAQADLGPKFASPLPTRGYTKNRSGAAYPLDLSLDRLPGRIGEQIHDIAFRAPFIEAKKFLNQKEIRQAMNEAFGKEYTDMINPWLENIRSNGGGMDNSGLHNLTDWARAGRENMTMMLIGFKPSTAIIHGGAAAANSIREAGAVPFFKAAANMLFDKPANHDKYSAMIYEKSAFMRNRKNYADRDIGAATQQIMNNSAFSTFRKNWMIAGTAMVANLDHFTALPTWLAIYHKEIASHGDEGRAVYAADQVTRNAHGANGLIDLPAIMRGNGQLSGEMLKFASAFGGYWNHNYNQLRDMSRSAREMVQQDGTYSQKQAKFFNILGGVLGYIIAPAFVHSFVRPAVNKEVNDDPFSNPSLANWGSFAKHAVEEQLMGTQFIARDLMQAYKSAEQGRGFRMDSFGTFGELMTGITSPLYYTEHPSNKKGDTSQRDKSYAEFAGWATGIGPSRTMIQASTYLKDYMQGRAQPPTTFKDWRRALFDGRPPAKRQ